MDETDRLIANASPAQLQRLIEYGIVSPRDAAAVPSGSPVSGGAGAAPLLASADAARTSLEHPETSETASPIQAFLAQHPDPTPLYCDLCESSGPARFRHSGWAPMRRRVYDSLKRTGQSSSRVSSFASCGECTTIERNNVDETRFRLKGSHCHDRLCTPCANARSFRVSQALLAQFPVDGALFITLTLCGKNEPLNDLIDRLYRSFKALRNHPTWSDKIEGGAAFLEVKWSDKAQRWHPHLHIVAVGHFIHQGELSDTWRGITKDSYIVDIRRIRNSEHAARYVTKYASKPLNTSFSNTPRLLDEAVVSLKGRRMCLCFGTWYGTPLSVAEDEELADDFNDAAGWHFWLGLDVVIERANSGEAEMIELLRKVGAEGRWRQSLTPGP